MLAAAVVAQQIIKVMVELVERVAAVMLGALVVEQQEIKQEVQEHQIQAVVVVVHLMMVALHLVAAMAVVVS
jgi:hypothetical protein